MKGFGPTRFCPVCGAPEYYLEFEKPQTEIDWSESPDNSDIVKCGECKSETLVTTHEDQDHSNIPLWTPFSERVQSALTDIRYNAQCLKQYQHDNTAATLMELTYKIDRHYRTLDPQHRENILKATQRILEHAQTNLPSGKTSQEYQEFQEAVDTIHGTLGITDQVNTQ